MRFAGVIHNGQNARLKKGLEALNGVHCGEIPRLVVVGTAVQQRCLRMPARTSLAAFARTVSYGRAGTVMIHYVPGFAVSVVLLAPRRSAQAPASECAGVFVENSVKAYCVLCRTWSTPGSAMLLPMVLEY